MSQTDQEQTKKKSTWRDLLKWPSSFAYGSGANNGSSEDSQSSGEKKK